MNDGEEADVPLQYRALYQYDAAQDDDLSLQVVSVGTCADLKLIVVQDETIYVLVVRDDGWCLGMNKTGSMGYFPQSYVQMLEDQDQGYERVRNSRASCLSHYI